MHEAEIEQTDTGRVPVGDGWFILNVAEMSWDTVPGGSTWCGFGAPCAPSQTLGIGVHVLAPGEPSAMYHRESEQEGFLVLYGECLVIVEGQERPMRTWDYFHCPAETAHITVGAGDGPCAILMVGARSPQSTTHYPVEPLAGKYGASVETATDLAREAYAKLPPITSAPAPWPPG
jgi:uncharacterized cupin superfamily protein